MATRPMTPRHEDLRHVRPEVITAVNIKLLAFVTWRSVVWWKNINVSEGLFVSMFSVEKYYSALQTEN
jgi:hypothetical protein